MKDFSIGELLSFIVPGGAVILGASLASPGLGKTMLGEGLSLGAGGTFLLLAFIVGHMTQAVGEVIGMLWWKLRKGFPTTWVRTGRISILSGNQMEALQAQWRIKLGLKKNGSIQEMDKDSWHSIIQQMYAAVMSGSSGNRLSIFTRSLLINRGMAAGSLILTFYTAVLLLGGLIFAIPLQFSWEVPIWTFSASMLFFVRMEQFGRRYARELFVQFIQLPGTEVRKD